ncbi:hypothetical protein KDK_46310 [Dictyobacter kobayashii]|uniref:Uncharacterized protein n=1 Tax=Dictyobacter kobayashii TaxID=2014872 RepID=A0A402ANQ2_9CHLR|nr:hypothetical protein KDK_46310 [Dictyobacter kobayashii]
MLSMKDMQATEVIYPADGASRRCACVRRRIDEKGDVGLFIFLCIALLERFDDFM